MAIDFPNSPVLNDTFTVGDRTWTWDGTRWEAVQENFLDLNVSSPLSYTSASQSLSIDLSSYYTSSQTDTFLNLKKDEINQTLSSDTTLVAGYRYFVDTSAARTLTLPATPAVGDEIQLFDASGTGSTNNVTINNNSNKINGTLDTALIDIDGFATVFVWTGSTYGWRMI